MIPLGNSFFIIYYSGIGVSLSIITWLVGYGFLISARKRVRTINLKYVISKSAVMAFIFGTTFSLTFGISIDESLLSTTRVWRMSFTMLILFGPQKYRKHLPIFVIRPFAFSTP
jgi:hypothetical protein